MEKVTEESCDLERVILPHWSSVPSCVRTSFHQLFTPPAKVFLGVLHMFTNTRSGALFPPCTKCPVQLSLSCAKAMKPSSCQSFSLCQSSIECVLPLVVYAKGAPNKCCLSLYNRKIFFFFF